jgi:hypothetical protein
MSLLQDKLIIVWSIVSYLTKKPAKEIIENVNFWIDEINSKLSPILTEESLLELI